MYVEFRVTQNTKKGRPGLDNPSCHIALFVLSIIRGQLNKPQEPKRYSVAADPERDSGMPALFRYDAFAEIRLPSLRLSRPCRAPCPEPFS